MRKRKIMVVALITLMGLLMTGCGKKKIDVTEDLTVNFDGYNGYGTAMLENEYAWESEALEAAGVKSIDTFSDLGDALVIEMAITYEVYPKENLSNGDEVTVIAQIDEDVAEEYKIKFVSNEIKFVVKGLPEIEPVDLFENIDISCLGIAPNVTAILDNANTDSYVSMRFKMDKSNNLNVGDVITVTADYNKEDLLEAGYIAESDAKEFVVEGVAQYVNELTQIPDELLEKMKKQMEDATKAYVAVEWSEEKKLKKMEYLGSYLLTVKDGLQRNNDFNMIYLIYRMDVENLDGNFSYYTYCKYKDLVILEDGTCSVDISNYSLPDGYEFFGNVSGEAFIKGKYYYIGYENIDSLFNNCVTKNIEYYEYESNVTVTE